jgi:hypothetical protein
MDSLRNKTNLSTVDLLNINLKISKKIKLLENIKSDIRKLKYKKMKLLKTKKSYKVNNNVHIVNHLLDNMNCLMINSNIHRSNNGYISDSSEDNYGF